MSEIFNEIPDTNIGGMDIYFSTRFRNRERLTFVTGDDSADLTVAQAKELRAFLDKAIPTHNTSAE
jgi:hypothetical protein